MKEIFRDIYLRNLWGDPESVSGPGSGLIRTAGFRDEISALLGDLKAESLLDAGCGDFNWMKELRLPVARYVGIDIVAELIADNQRKYGNQQRVFACANIACDALPRADLILSRDCLVHFSFADALAALENFKKSGARFLLTTTFLEFPENLDVETGGWRRLNLQRPPFNFPIPDRMIDERSPRHGAADKRLALWPLDAISV